MRQRMCRRTNMPMIHAAAQQRDEPDEGGLEVEQNMVGVSRHGVAATEDRGGVVRPLPLIASVGPT